jgi:hypothetical protein
MGSSVEAEVLGFPGELIGDTAAVLVVLPLVGKEVGEEDLAAVPDELVAPFGQLLIST